MTKKIVLLIIVILWACVIFWFSSQGAINSNDMSTEVTEKIVSLSPKNNNLKEASKNAIILELNLMVRKSAHFSLFLIFGVLVTLLVKCYNFKSLNLFYTALLICLLYAISDEFHQFFVPGRGAQWKDVLIDFSGSFLGSSIIFLYLKIKSKYKNVCIR